MHAASLRLAMVVALAAGLLAGCLSGASPEGSGTATRNGTLLAPCADLPCVVATQDSLGSAFVPLVRTDTIVTTMAFAQGRLYWRDSTQDTLGKSGITSMDIASGELAPVFGQAGARVSSVNTFGDAAWFTAGPADGGAHTTYRWTAAEGLAAQSWAPSDGSLLDVGNGWAAFDVGTDEQTFAVHDVGTGARLLTLPGQPGPNATAGQEYVNGVADIDGAMVLPWHNRDPAGRVLLVQVDPWTGENRSFASTRHDLDSGFSLTADVLTFLEDHELWALSLTDGKEFRLSQPGYWSPWADQEGSTVYYLKEHLSRGGLGAPDDTAFVRLDAKTGAKESWPVEGPGYSYTGGAAGDGYAFVSMVESTAPPKSTIYAMRL